MKTFTEYLLESEKTYGGKSFREVSALIRKEFPTYKYKIVDKKKAYYSPAEGFKIFNLYSGHIDVECKEIYLEEGDEIKLLNFLKKLKIYGWPLTKWTQSSTCNIYILSDDSFKKAKKQEREKTKREEADRVNAQLQADRSKKASELRERYKKELLPKLVLIPLFRYFSAPSIGSFEILEVKSDYITVSTIGSIHTYSASNQEGFDKIVKLIDFMYNESSIKQVLNAKYNGKKYGI